MFAGWFACKCMCVRVRACACVRGCIFLPIDLDRAHTVTTNLLKKKKKISKCVTRPGKVSEFES